MWGTSVQVTLPSCILHGLLPASASGPRSRVSPAEAWHSRICPHRQLPAGSPGQCFPRPCPGGRPRLTLTQRAASSPWAIPGGKARAEAAVEPHGKGRRPVSARTLSPSGSPPAFPAGPARLGPQPRSAAHPRCRSGTGRPTASGHHRPPAPTGAISMAAARQDPPLPWRRRLRRRFRPPVARALTLIDVWGRSLQQEPATTFDPSAAATARRLPSRATVAWQRRRGAAMEATSLPAALELAAGGGAGLSPEKRAVLGASLLLLQRDYRFERVWFWGCIQGVRGTYYIAEGLGPDRAAPRSRLYRCGGRAGPHHSSV